MGAAAKDDLASRLARLATVNRAAHARLVRAVDELFASKESESAGCGPLPVSCALDGCDAVLLGQDAWTEHSHAVHGWPAQP